MTTAAQASLRAENAELRSQLEGAEEALRAIRGGDVDALVIEGAAGPQLYMLQGQDADANRIRGEMLAQVSDAVVAVDDGARITYLNAACERLYGMPAKQALGRKLPELYETRWHRPGDAAAARIALRDQAEWHGECIHIRSDGRAVQVDVAVTRLTGAAGQQGGMLAVIRDVTERKRHEEKLLVSEIRYRRLFETAHDGILIVDPDTRKIIDANPYMTHILGYPHGQLLGKELFEIGLLRDQAESQEMVRSINLAQEIRYDNLPLRSQDGQLQHVEVVANQYDESGRPVIQFNIRDISERKRAEAHVHLLMAEVNHRARNLLAVVQAIAQQTAKHGDPATFAARLSDRINSLAAGQDLLVRSHWKGVEVRDLSEAQLVHFRDLFGTRIFTEGPQAMLKPAAAQGIGMALHELSTNAAKHGALCGPAGTVHVTWGAVGGAAPGFWLRWVESGGPRVAAPTRSGFGSLVIGRMAEAAVGGTVRVDFAAHGLVWDLRAPADHALAAWETVVNDPKNDAC